MRTQKTTKPSFAYVLEDVLRPGLVKIGLADRPIKRFRAQRTGNIGLKLSAIKPYFDRSQDREVRKFFADSREELEWHRQELSTVLQAIDRSNESFLAARSLDAEHQDFHYNTGLVPLPTKIPANKLPALKWLLSQTCPTLPLYSVAQVIRQALCGDPSNCRQWARGLRAVGLELQSTDKLVVFDKSPKGNLSRFFQYEEPDATWRQQLEGLAGLDSRLKPVTLARWLSYTQCDPSLKARVVV